MENRDLKTHTVRGFSFWNMKKIFPIILLIGFPIYFLFEINNSIIPNSFIYLIISMGLLGVSFLIILLYQFLVTIYINEKTITEKSIFKKKEIIIKEIETFEVFKNTRYGSVKLDKSDLLNSEINFRSERIILISKLKNKKPSPWWKTDPNSISITFKPNLYSKINEIVYK